VRIRFAVAPAAGWQEPDRLGPFVDALEALRFDTVWLSDLPVGSPVDPLLGLAFAAARTARLKLGANVVPHGRNPFRFAKELAQIDQLSGGRLLLSFVPGIGTPDERRMLGFASADRGAYLEAVIPRLRQWWAGEAVAYRGDGFDVPALVLDPLPVQQPLEIWLGGRGPRALERVGRFADGWLGSLSTPHAAGVARRTIEDAASRAGRSIDPDHFGVGISYARVEPAAEVVEGLRSRLAPGAELAEVLPIGRDALQRHIDEHVAEGISKFVVRAVGPTTPPDAELAWLAEVVLAMQT
jgi:probable F420-dependent oxidoreductase